MLKTESEFAKRIAAVHSSKAKDGDVRREELEAMFDVFLGSKVDPSQRREIEKLQINLLEEQEKLFSALEQKTLSTESYVDRFNDLLAFSFNRCEAILGRKDFLRLFGAPTERLGGFIDKQAFLQTMEPKAEKKSYGRAAPKARRQLGFMRPLKPDAKLSAVVGSKPLPRSELTKKLWDYIKKNGLRDKKKKTQIHADRILRPIFNGKKKVSMSEMAKLISRHIR